MQAVLIENALDTVVDLRQHYREQQWHIYHCQQYNRKSITNIVLQINNKYWIQPDQFEMMIDEFGDPKGTSE